jgi:hypothetical protein
MTNKTKIVKPTASRTVEAVFPKPMPSKLALRKTSPKSMRGGSKQARLIEMLQRPDGATIAQMTKVTHWQVHSVRGVMSGVLKKRLGLKIVNEKKDSGERVYRIKAA